VLPDHLVGSAIRAVYPRVEPELRRIAEFVPRGGTAVDLGAWYGPWTQRMTMLADHVVAIEPAPRLADHLRTAFPGVQVVEAAASDHDGTAALYLPESGPGVGVSSLERGRGDFVTVRLTTLDALDLTDVTFIKLDVEGHEMPVLRGGATTIQRDGPTLLVELEERIQPIQPVLDLLGQWGYVGSVLPNGDWVPLAHFDLGAHQRATIARVDHSFLRHVVWPRPRYVNSVLFRPA
jgi:FkbM family methyltransferase